MSIHENNRYAAGRMAELNRVHATIWSYIANSFPNAALSVSPLAAEVHSAERELWAASDRCVVLTGGKTMSFEDFRAAQHTDEEFNLAELKTLADEQIDDQDANVARVMRFLDARGRVLLAMTETIDSFNAGVTPNDDLEQPSGLIDVEFYRLFVLHNRQQQAKFRKMIEGEDWKL